MEEARVRSLSYEEVKESRELSLKRYLETFGEESEFAKNKKRHQDMAAKAAEEKEARQLIEEVKEPGSNPGQGEPQRDSVEIQDNEEIII